MVETARVSSLSKKLFATISQDESRLAHSGQRQSFTAQNCRILASPGERETTPFSPAQMSFEPAGSREFRCNCTSTGSIYYVPRRIFRINPRIQQTNIRLLDKIALQTQKIFLQKRKLNAPILSALCPSFPHKFRIRTSNGLSYSLKTGHVSPTTPVKITIIMLNTLLGKPQVTKCRLSIRLLPKCPF